MVERGQERELGGGVAEGENSFHQSQCVSHVTVK